MGKIKKVLLGLIAVAAMAVICAVSAGAEELSSGLWRYEKQGDGTVHIASYSGFSKDLTIPSTIEGLTVTGIKQEAFLNNTNIGKITLPSSVSFIGVKAFAGSSLTSINIPSTVTGFGTSWSNSNAFDNCDSLTTVYFNASTVVPQYAFAGCDKLTTVTIGDATTGIDKGAFLNCPALKTVKIGNKVEYIGEEAFMNSTSLQSVTCGSSIKTIDNEAFNSSGITSFTIPKSVTFIGHDAFRATKLKSINVPANVTGFGTSWSNSCVFSECDEMTTVVFNASGVVPQYAFSGCDKLTTVTIGDTTTGIDRGAFKDCPAMKTVKIGNGVQYIGDEAFRDSKALQTFSCGEALASIGDSAFAGTGLKSFCIPRNVTFLGHYAFGASSLESIFMSSLVESWGTSWGSCYTFADCANLKTVTIGESKLPMDIGDLFTNSPNVKIYCMAGSSAQEYAKQYGISNSATIKPIKTTSIKFSKEEYTLALGETLKLYPTITPQNTTDRIEWISGNTDIATINSAGVVTGVAVGQVAIQLKSSSGKEATCIINISKGAETSTDKVVKKNIALGYTNKLSDVTYTGSAQKPSVGVMFNAFTKLVPNVDYKIAYSNNVNVGTATIKITGIGNYTGTITKTFKILPKNVTGLKLGGRASNALRLNWNKNTTADGYIIEQYKNGKWVRIAKTSSNATTTYRVSGLAAGTVYKFRMKAYKTSGSTALYSAYTSTLSACTNPSNVTGVKIGGKASTALRLNWTKNTSAGGYIVEIYKSGKWVRAAKITSNATVTYRISGLSKNTTYKIRIKAYKMSGSTALYSGYTTISGKTTA